jgi:hypothetical protein
LQPVNRPKMPDTTPGDSRVNTGAKRITLSIRDPVLEDHRQAILPLYTRCTLKQYFGGEDGQIVRSQFTLSFRLLVPVVNPPIP